MVHGPKRKLEIQPRETNQQNLHHPDDHGEFSHLLTSNKLMIITRRENHTTETYNKQNGKLE